MIRAVVVVQHVCIRRKLALGGELVDNARQYLRKPGQWTRQSSASPRGGIRCL